MSFKRLLEFRSLVLRRGSITAASMVCALSERELALGNALDQQGSVNGTAPREINGGECRSTQAFRPDRSRDQHSVLMLIDELILLQQIGGCKRRRENGRNVPRFRVQALACPGNAGLWPASFLSIKRRSEASVPRLTAFSSQSTFFLMNVGTSRSPVARIGGDEVTPFPGRPD